MMNESSATALYETEGRLVACDAGFIEMLSEWGSQRVTLPLNLAAHPTGTVLLPLLSEMTASDCQELDGSLIVSGKQYRIQLRRLSNQETQFILINLSRLAVESKESSESDLRALHLIHDFKNQLGGLKLYAAYLKKRMVNDAEGSEVCEKIIHGLNAMAERSRLVTRLVQPMVLSLVETNLSAMLDEVVQGLNPQAQEQDVQISLDLSAEPPLMKLDGILLRDALQAVIRRAIYVTEAGKRVMITSSVNIHDAVIEVQDAGPRIAAERQKRFFDLGRSAASLDGIEAQPLRDEMAIKMALARRIVEQHGGYLRVNDAAMGGTSVQIHLPHSRS
ncbi:MAG TPA: HAMP domain-containing sensor histidine kinase [Blastocatellia bacterium]|nr:HAMP domain-containing sensor histidine kinase [Blastocatellia bacterium]